MQTPKRTISVDKLLEAFSQMPTRDIERIPDERKRGRAWRQVYTPPASPGIERDHGDRGRNEGPGPQ